MKVNSDGIELLHSFESCRLTAYLCPANKWTIGWGNTFYENKTSVKKGDKITQERADQLFLNILSRFENEVKSLVKVPLNCYQFSALVSFAYNCGSDIDADTIAEGLGDSTLLRKVNANPADPAISDEFMKWTRANGQVLGGLIKRRKAEAKLYFKV
jgi:lysozyme